MCAGLGPTPCSAPVAFDGGQGCHAEIMLLGAALPCCARLATQHSLTTRALPADRLPPIAGAGQGELDRARVSRDSPPRTTRRRATPAGRMSASRATFDVARGLTFRTDWPSDRALKWPRCAGARAACPCTRGTHLCGATPRLSLAALPRLPRPPARTASPHAPARRLSARPPAVHPTAHRAAARPAAARSSCSTSSLTRPSRAARRCCHIWRVPQPQHAPVAHSVCM